MELHDWVPAIAAVITGIAVFIPVWFKTRKEAGLVSAETASTLTEGAGTLVDKYEKILIRMERRIEAQEQEIEELCKRVAALEEQLKEAGIDPAT